MRERYHSDNGAPCWKCSCTIYTYTVDDTVTYVGATCITCGADNMFDPPKFHPLDFVALVSAAHRTSRGYATLKEQRMVNAHQLGMRDQREGREMIIPIFLTDADERTAYDAGYLGAAKRSVVGVTCANCVAPIEVTTMEDCIECTECGFTFCDNCYDTGKGDGCKCHVVQS